MRYDCASIKIIIEHYRENGQTAEMLRAYDVLRALEAKQGLYAAAAGALNGTTFNLPKRVNSGYVVNAFEGTNASSAQLEYMCSMYAVERANPGAYESGEQAVNAVSNVGTAKGLFDSLPHLVWPILKEATKTAVGNWFSNIIDENTKDKY